MSEIFRIQDSVAVPMRDGTRLMTDVWLPAGEGPWPVLLQRTPYRKEDVHGAQYISALEFQSALRRGFAVVVQDTRGRYASEGRFDPFHNEAKDGVDTIGWLRQQAFCNGKVAMFGASYVGATQVLAAAEDPDGLVAISPQLTTARHGETWMYRSGATELGFLILWIIEALGTPDLERRLVAMEKGAAGRVTAFLSKLRSDPETALSHLPVIEPDLLSLAPYAAEWFDDARAAAAPQNRERLDDLAKSRPAMLVTAGWNDLFVEGSIELFETARRRHGSRDVPDRLIIGPWSHGNPKDWQGAFWHGYSASMATLSDVQLDFFESIMRGKTTSRPLVTYFRSGSNTWHHTPDWPLPGAEEKVFYLYAEQLTVTAPTEPWSRSYISDTVSPVPTVGGATFLPGLLLGRNSGPMEQSAIEKRDDVLVFTSPPLSSDMEVTGLVTAQIFVRSTALTADWTARLCEVLEDGRSFGLVDGIIRWVNPYTRREEGPAEVEIRLGHISHLFRAASRVRLQIASSNFPRFNRNPQTSVPANHASAADFARACQTVLGGSHAASRLILPVIPKAFPSTACPSSSDVHTD